MQSCQVCRIANIIFIINQIFKSEQSAKANKFQWNQDAAIISPIEDIQSQFHPLKDQQDQYLVSNFQSQNFYTEPTRVIQKEEYPESDAAKMLPAKEDQRKENSNVHLRFQPEYFEAHKNKVQKKDKMSELPKKILVVKEHGSDYLDDNVAVELDDKDVLNVAERQKTTNLDKADEVNILEKNDKTTLDKKDDENDIDTKKLDVKDVVNVLETNDITKMAKKEDVNVVEKNDEDEENVSLTREEVKYLHELVDKQVCQILKNCS